MFGMGFTEMLLIAVVAILFLGPDKLPSTMVEIAKFFRNVKSTIGTVKDSLEEEMHISEIKQEALAYKQELMNTSERLNREVADIPSQAGAKLTNLTDDILEEDEDTTSKASKEEQEATFKKKKKIEKTEKEEDNKDV